MAFLREPFYINRGVVLSGLPSSY